MDQHLEMIAENEREWRQYMMRKVDELSVKVDHIDKELSTFKIRVFSFASLFGGGMGLSADYIKNIFFHGG